MTVKMPIDPRTMPDGVVLVLSVCYRPNEGEKPNPTIYEHAAIKSKGFWHLTGSGPSAAGWGAVERWLERDNRELIRIEIQTGTKTIWPEAESTAMLSDLPG